MLECVAQTDGARAYQVFIFKLSNTAMGVFGASKWPIVSNWCELLQIMSPC